MFESYSFEVCQNTITDKLFLVCFQIISDKSDFSLNPGPVKILKPGPVTRGWTPSTLVESDEVLAFKFSDASIFMRDPRTMDITQYVPY